MQFPYAGMHWPNGAEDYNALINLPSSLYMMLATEARYHYNKVRQAGNTVIWRGLPRVGRRPAELGWNASRAASESLNLWDEQPHGGEEYFVPFNELDLNYERGDNDDDYASLHERYSLVGNFLYDVGLELRVRLPNTYLLFPPFTPDHGDWEHLHLWRHALTHYNGLVIHAYENDHSSLDDVYNRIRGYCLTFPDKMIFVGEWNAPHPEEFLKVLARCSAEFSNFMGATYFIWHWHNPAPWWPDWYNVDRNGTLYNLFLNPPTHEEPVPQPEPVPVPDPEPEPDPMPTTRPYSKEEVVEEAKVVAHEFGLPARVLVALLNAESGLRWNAARYAYRRGDGSFANLTERAEAALARADFSDFAGVLVEISNNNSNDVSFGVGQQTVRWADEGTHELTVENVVFIRELYFNVPFAIRKAAKQLAYYYNVYQDDLEALCRYNKPNLPGNQNPNRNNYNNSLNRADELLGLSPQPNPTPAPPDASVVASHRPGFVAGTYSGRPAGVILHGSRSGVVGNPKSREFAGTVNWAQRNPDGLGWTATIGENEYATHMDVTQWGHNARNASRKYLAVEFAQAWFDEPITDAQVNAFVAFMKNEVLSRWPDFPLYFPTHAEVERSGETGARDGKTDVFTFGHPLADELRARIMAKLQAPEPEPIPEPEPGGLTMEERAELERLRNIVGYLTHDIADILEEKVVNKPIKSTRKRPLKADLSRHIAELRQEATAIVSEIRRQV
jgi:hypothetical protein